MTKTSSPSVAIIGAGLGGIAAAVHLKRAGISEFTIFEKSAGPGGTWWDNTYPGAECDIEIAFYAYSFMPHDWPRTHASQPEIQAYIQRVIEHFDLAPHLKYNTAITEAVWDDQRHFYTLTAAGGSTMRFDAVVAALGLLNVPRYPEWPGLEQFKGPKFHTARWEHQHDLRGKHVAVVGNGSSAAQVVPAIAPVAGHVSMFAREPAYIMFKGERELTPGERRKHTTALGRKLERARVFMRIERAMSVRDPQSKTQRNMVAAYFDYRDRIFAARPDLRELTTPDYPFACKRPVASNDLLPALTRDNVTLIQRSVAAVNERGLIDTEGVEYPVDSIVMSTGFQPWNFLATLQVIGRGGREIHGVWGDQPEAFLGIQVAGFPNFFMMYGPNTNYMCVTFMLERQAEYIARAMRRLKQKRATAIDVRRSAMDAYNHFVGRTLAKKTLEGNCHNYYHSASGRNVVTWPWRGTWYALLTRFCGPALFTRRATAERQAQHLELGRSMLRPLIALVLGTVIAGASLTASAADQTPYQIIAVLSQTGAAAFIGASESRMLAILAETVNRSGGIKGRPIAFHITDDQSNPVLTVQLINGLIAQHVPMIFGPGFTATCAATMALAMKTGPVMWCMAPGIYPEAGSYVFSTQSTTDQTMIVMVRYFRLRGWKRMAAILSTDASGQAFDHGLATALALPENRDVQLVAHEHMSPTDITISAQAERIKAAQPQVLMTLATGSPWGTIMRGVSDAGITVPIGGGNGNLIISQLDQYKAFLPTEMYFPGNIAVAPDSVGRGPIQDAQAVYFNAFKAAGIKPDLGYNIGWDPAMILVSALRTLGTQATAQQVRDYIVNLHGWVGINGVYDFRDGMQRGIGQQSQVMDRWDKTRSVFIAVSRPAGYLKAK